MEERQTAGNPPLLAGYAAPSAWRKDYHTAGERFLAVQRLAGELPEGGARPSRLGEAPQAKFKRKPGSSTQCAQTLQGDKAGAGAEWILGSFMRRYPQSILVHAALKRIARLHSPATFLTARINSGSRRCSSRRSKADQERREQALCGPECLAELLRRQGKTADVHALADAMKTGADGTSLQSLAEAAKQPVSRRRDWH